MQRYFMEDYFKNLIFNIGLKHRLRGWKLLSFAAKKYLDGFHNVNYEFTSNGEYLVIKKIAAFPIKTIFDVGANVGKWSTLAAEHFKEAVIYSFELVPPTFELLAKNINGIKNIKAFNLGMSNQDGKIPIDFYGAGDGKTTTILDMEVYDKKPRQRVEGIVTTGDKFGQSNGITKIDFLKIDVEGAEPYVLEGFSSYLTNHKIDIIQFEYGMGSIYTKFLLKDFYELLSDNYIIGKIFPNGVNFSVYNPKEEDFKGPNYIAVSKQKPEYVEALKIK